MSLRRKRLRVELQNGRYLEGHLIEKAGPDTAQSFTSTPSVDAGDITRERASSKLKQVQHRAIVLHAHPKLGGSPYDPVVVGISSLLAHKGYVVSVPELGSDTFSWTGRQELEDVEELIKVESQKLKENDRLVLVGYSFGACLAVAAAASADAGAHVFATVSISYPAGCIARIVLGWMRSLSSTGMIQRALMVIGDMDHFCSTSTARTLYLEIKNAQSQRSASERESDSPPADISLEIIPEADHFWIGKDQLAVDAVDRFLDRLFFNSS